MNEQEVRKRAFAMPLTSPAYPPGPYRFYDREFFIIAYRTDPEKLKVVIPAPLEFTEPIVKYEFIRMPDSTGFGDYTESGQVIPVSFRGEKGGYVHSMYLDCDPPIAGGRELWGFPKKLASPVLKVEKDTLGGVLRFGPVPVAVATMGYKHRALDIDTVREFGRSAGLSSKDHSACRRHAAHLRNRPIPVRRGYRARRVDRTRGAGIVPPRARASR